MEKNLLELANRLNLENIERYRVREQKELTANTRDDYCDCSI